MRSKIYASEIVANRERRFGSATVYYPANLVRADGTEAPMLFTADELDDAAARATANPEDMPDAEKSERRWLWVTVALLSVSAVLSVLVIAGALSWIG